MASLTGVNSYKSLRFVSLSPQMESSTRQVDPKPGTIIRNIVGEIRHTETP